MNNNRNNKYESNTKDVILFSADYLQRITASI